MLEVLRQYIEQYERKWVDEAIPALDGLTPRQALAKGGAARRKLDDLLDGMEQMESENSMSARRVREALGLTKQRGDADQTRDAPKAKSAPRKRASDS
jgi:hypothetical protein